MTEVEPPVLKNSLNIWTRLIGRQGADAYLAMSSLDSGKPSDQLVWYQKSTNNDKFHIYYYYRLAKLLDPYRISTAAELDTLAMEWKTAKNNSLSFMANYDVIVGPVAPVPAIPHYQATNIKHLMYLLLFTPPLSFLFLSLSLSLSVSVSVSVSSLALAIPSSLSPSLLSPLSFLLSYLLPSLLYPSLSALALSLSPSIDYFFFFFF